MSRGEKTHATATRHFTWVLWAFLAIAAFFLITEHRAHLYGLLPYALVLACPLMHLVMHRGHGHRGHGDHEKTPGARAQSERARDT